MKKLIVFILLSFMTVSFAQEENKGLRPDFLVAPLKLGFDGETSILNSSAYVGVAKDISLFGLEMTPGLYGSFGIDTTQDADWKFGLAMNVKVFGLFGIGVFYDGWLEGRGIIKPEKANTGFLVFADLSL